MQEDCAVSTCGLASPKLSASAAVADKLHHGFMVHQAMPMSGVESSQDALRVTVTLYGPTSSKAPWFQSSTQPRTWHTAQRSG